jgi:hypothetical protein
MKRPLLERRVLLVWKAEGLVHPGRQDRRGQIRRRLVASASGVFRGRAQGI